MSWVQTASGRRVDFLNPDPAQIDLSDVARALGGTCRYMGGTTEHYSVAEHSFRMSTVLFERWQKETRPGESRNLLRETLSAHFHDATEAYMGDLPHPLKQLMPDAVRNWFDTIERRLGTAMEVAFGLPKGTITSLPHSVRQLDAFIVGPEREQFLHLGEVSFAGWNVPESRLFRMASGWNRREGAAIWLARANELLVLWKAEEAKLTP